MSLLSLAGRTRLGAMWRVSTSAVSLAPAVGGLKVILQSYTVACLTCIAIFIDCDVADLNIRREHFIDPIREGDVMFVVSLLIVIFQRIAIHLCVVIFHTRGVEVVLAPLSPDRDCILS